MKQSKANGCSGSIQNKTIYRREDGKHYVQSGFGIRGEFSFGAFMIIESSLRI